MAVKSTRDVRRPAVGKAAAKVDPKAVADRGKLYPEEKVLKHFGKNPLTAADAKEFLDWQEEPEGGGWGNDFLFRDLHGKKIRCGRSIWNRPFEMDRARKVQQSLLKKRWRRNGETIIIGWYGSVCNGNHSFVGLVLAQQALDMGQKPLWKENWPGGVVEMEKYVIVGISEDDDVVDTIDTCDPRTLADVVARSDLFADMRVHDKPLTAMDLARIGRMTEFAVNLLWQRTGRSCAESDGLQTHAESMAFIRTHPGVIDCVGEMFLLDKRSDGELGRVLSPGYCAGLLYLMGTSETKQQDVDDYHAAVDAGQAEEKYLSWSAWERAVQFWRGVASREGQFKTLFEARRPDILEPGKYQGCIFAKGEGGGTRREKLAVLCRAWFLFSETKSFTAKSLSLSYKEESGRQILDVARLPEAGGVDVGFSRPRKPDPRAQAIEEEAKKHTRGRKPAHGEKTEIDGKGLAERLKSLRKNHPEAVFVFPEGDWVCAYGSDAASIGRRVRKKPERLPSGLAVLRMSEGEAEGAMDALLAEGFEVLIAQDDGGEIHVDAWQGSQDAAKGEDAREEE